MLVEIVSKSTSCPASLNRFVLEKLKGGILEDGVIDEAEVRMLRAVIYGSGGTQWLIYQTPSAGTARNTLGGWVVPNLDDAMRELRAKGVEFEDYALGDQGPTTENGVARDPNGGAAAWFKDSEDNILSLTQLPPGMELPVRAG